MLPDNPLYGVSGVQAGIIYLGVGASAPVPGRGLASIALIYKGSIYLFDVGEGTQERLVALGLSPLRIRAVFITHLHGDHFFGLPGLLQFMTLSSRKAKLSIIAPKGIEDYIANAERVTGHLRSFDIDFVDVKSGLVYRDENINVYAYPVCHGSIRAYGFVVEEHPRPGRVRVDRLEQLGVKPGPFISRLRRGESVIVNNIVLKPEDVIEPPRRGFKIVYTGDTRPCITTVENAREADLLIHDATFSSSEVNEAREKGHSTVREAALVARLAKAKCLALIHFSARYRDVYLLAREASSLMSCAYAAEPQLLHVIRL